MKIAGFDIGGANTDLAVIDFENGEIKEIKTDFEYLPMWSQNDKLDVTLIAYNLLAPEINTHNRNNNDVINPS